MSFTKALILFAALVLAACTSSSMSPNCDPPCRSGYACSGGSCVSGCNPPCGAGTVCSGYGASAMCVSGISDGAANDASQPDVPIVIDAPSIDGMDVAMTNDVPAVDVAGMDGFDVPVTTDAADARALSDVAIDAPPPCGHAGESCCYTTFCNPGFECGSAGTCQAVVHAANECTRPADCTSPQICAGPTTCGDHGCFTCVAPPGTAAFGAACSAPSDCTTGVCRGGHCTVACNIGGTGDTDCNARSTGYICTQLLFRTGTPPATTVVALGVCRQSCTRLGDCTAAGETCLPQLNDVTNTMNFICGVSSGVLPAGATCTDGSMCMSFLCIPGYGDGGTSGVCTAPCVIDSDCPTAAPHCMPITWGRPDGTGQPGRACLP